MPKFHSSYPDGPHGIALLVLRLCHAAAALSILTGLNALPLFARIAMPMAVIVAILLVAGLGTRYASFVLGCAAAWSAAASHEGLALLLIAQAGGSVALMVLGAGAYSLDARIFGRRVIHLGG